MPEYRHHETEVRYVQAPVEVYHESHYEPVHHGDDHMRYVEVPEVLYDKFITENVHHEEAALLEAPLSEYAEHYYAPIHHEQVIYHESPDYAKHYTSDYYVNPHQTVAYKTVD